MKKIEGFLNINKEKGLTSHDVVQRIRRILKIKRVGHTGTLDPDADGVMLVCIGRAARTSLFINDLNKEYKAVMTLGSSTNTQDASGDTVETAPVPDLTRQEIEQALDSFLGETEQIPPMFSAIKKNGIPLYVLAREGKTSSRSPRKINIYANKLISISLPFVTFKVTCSSGTYIRTLCEDLGKKLGTVAHLHELTRTAVGKFSIEQSLSLSELESKVTSEEDSYGFVIPTEEGISHYPKAIISSESASKALNGVAIPVSSAKVENSEHTDLKNPNTLRLFTEDNRFFGIGEKASPESELISIKKILVEPDDFKIY